MMKATSCFSSGFLTMILRVAMALLAGTSTSGSSSTFPLGTMASVGDLPIAAPGTWLFAIQVLQWTCLPARGTASQA